MKSRGCYETPGGTIMLKAHRAIESICLDREVAHLKDDLMPRYASLIYNGFWWAPAPARCIPPPAPARPRGVREPGSSGMCWEMRIPRVSGGKTMSDRE